MGALASIIVAVEAGARHRRWIESRPGDYGPQTLARLRAGLLYPGSRYVEALCLRAKILAEVGEAAFSKVDVLFAPTMPMSAPTLQASDLGAGPEFFDYIGRFGRCTRPASYLGLPAISVPAGLTPEGMPCGLQLVGRPFDESTLLQVAAAFEREVQFPRCPVSFPEVRRPMAAGAASGVLS
jgi:aspartyl-tRNA(Asn)/glutamyl-tRNA(Gln) amidotransferase subunit A